MRALFTVDLSRKLNDGEVRHIFSNLLLNPTDIPASSDRDNPTDDEEKALLEYFRQRASPILARMPGDTEDQRAKKARVQDAIRYCSVLPATATQYMVTREIDGALTIRLVNDKIEFLQEGCEDLIGRLGLSRPWWRRWGQRPPLNLANRIEIYEHGLEASTIRGSLVRSKIGYAFRHSSKDLVIAGGAAVVFAVVFALIASGSVVPTSKLAGHLDRLGTAMVTTVIVSLYSIVHIIVSATPPVQWTAYYEKEE